MRLNTGKHKSALAIAAEEDNTQMRELYRTLIVFSGGKFRVSALCYNDERKKNDDDSYDLTMTS